MVLLLSALSVFGFPRTYRVHLKHDHSAWDWIASSTPRLCILANSSSECHHSPLGTPKASFDTWYVYQVPSDSSPRCRYRSIWSWKAPISIPICTGIHKKPDTSLPIRLMILNHDVHPSRSIGVKLCSLRSRRPERRQAPQTITRFRWMSIQQLHS